MSLNFTDRQVFESAAKECFDIMANASLPRYLELLEGNIRLPKQIVCISTPRVFRGSRRSTVLVYFRLDIDHIVSFVLPVMHFPACCALVSLDWFRTFMARRRPGLLCVQVVLLSGLLSQGETVVSLVIFPF